MNDGDKGLVVQDETIINVAKRDCEGVVPLYYEMLKAKDEKLTNEKIYNALTSAYKANIGIISNEITKIWDTDNPNVDAVKWLCMYNNFVIDYAKTLFLPEKPQHVEEELKKFSKMKLPHFFKYAKDKEDKQVGKLNNSTVNKLEKIIPNKSIQFKKVAGYTNYRLMMSNKYPVHDLNRNRKIIERFIELNKSKNNMTTYEGFDSEGFNKLVRDEMLKILNNESYISDILVEYFFKTDSAFKKTLWECYGKYIYENLTLNLIGTVSCEECSDRFEGKSNERLCEHCKKERKRQQDRIADMKYREKLKR